MKEVLADAIPHVSNQGSNEVEPRGTRPGKVVGQEAADSVDGSGVVNVHDYQRVRFGL